MKAQTPASPNIPLAPTEWGSQFHDQYSNVLRLYFNQLSASLQAVFGPLGGQYLSFPHGEFTQLTDAPATAVNTPMLVPLDTTEVAFGVSRPSSGRVQMAVSGMWNCQFSVQFRNPDTQAHNAYIWVRKNGADVPDTASGFTIPSKHGGGDGFLIGAANFYVPLNAQDYAELWWATDSTQISLDAVPAQTTPYPRPRSPAVVLTTTFVSLKD